MVVGGVELVMAASAELDVGRSSTYGAGLVPSAVTEGPKDAKGVT